MNVKQLMRALVNEVLEIILSSSPLSSSAQCWDAARFRSAVTSASPTGLAPGSHIPLASHVEAYPHVGLKSSHLSAVPSATVLHSKRDSGHTKLPRPPRRLRRWNA